MAESLVLVPGMMCDARAFWHQLVSFSALRPVTVAVPLRGASVEEMARILLDDLPGDMALVGEGLGGNVALEMQRLAPERVTRLALIGVAVQAEPPGLKAEREARIVAAQVGRLAEAAAADLPEGALHPDAPEAEIRGMLRDMALELGVEVYLRQCRAMQRRADQQKALRRIMMPVLVACGAEDPVTLPRRHEFMAEMLPYGRLQLIDRAGHLPALERPGAVSRMLRDWLA